ncbi:MAG TPA: hypothetical protein VIV11_43545 [Kofleriaceae bacterium]
MSGAVCPSCGVAVVPGYVRCPKCHKPLPQRRASHLEGGTAVQTSRSFPTLAIVAAVVLAAGIIAYFALRGGDKPATQQAEAAETDVDQTAPEPQLLDQPEAQPQPAAPDPARIAADFERTLKKQRLWATVAIVGDHVDVRSGSCSDAAMIPAFDAVAPSFKAAGLTRMRCLEQSGRVVVERDL